PLAILFARVDLLADVTIPSRSRQAVPLLLALVAILLGIASALPFEVLSIGRPSAAEEGL
ncbi:MAG: hypothetical protein ACK4GT_15280, partial [Pararhodobacter sp.]